MSWPAYVLLALGIAALVAAALADRNGSRRPGRVRAAATDPVCEPAAESGPPAFERDPYGMPLAERVRLIAGIADAGGIECGAVLVAAFERETEPAARDAVLVALRELGYPDCAGVLAEALASPRVAERLRAVELAAAIDARERLLPALADPALPVAIAAAYGLGRLLPPAALDELTGRLGPERRAVLAGAVGIFR